MEPTHAPLNAETTDADLVTAVVRGDARAFELLFERHRQRVAAIGGRFFQQPAQVEEIVQESFTKAYLALPSFSQHKVDSFAHWLARIAFNSCYDELRKQKRSHERTITAFTNAEREEVRALISGVEPETVESAAINRDLANKLLRLLSAEDRLVLVLLDVEGLS